MVELVDPRGDRLRALNELAESSGAEPSREALEAAEDEQWLSDVEALERLVTTADWGVFDRRMQRHQAEYENYLLNPTSVVRDRPPWLARAMGGDDVLKGLVAMARTARTLHMVERSMYTQKQLFLEAQRKRATAERMDIMPTDEEVQAAMASAGPYEVGPEIPPFEPGVPE